MNTRFKPIKLSKFKTYRGRVLRLKTPIQVELKKCGKYLEYNIPEYDVSGLALHRKQAKAEIISWFGFLWESYAKYDGRMTPGAIELKELLLKNIYIKKEIKNDIRKNNSRKNG